MTQQRMPVVALVGRPNVGKSTLFNRWVGRRASIVDDHPGVTRDRLVAEAELEPGHIRLIDTGGLDADPDDPFLTRMRAQTQLAVDEADVVVLVIDAVAGIGPGDTFAADVLRRSNKPVVLVANKLDTPRHEATHLPAVHELGIDPVIATSAEHGWGMDGLVEAVTERLEALGLRPWEAPDDDVADPDAPGLDEALDTDGDTHEDTDGGESAEACADEAGIEWTGGPIRVAVVGRPNVGKSSLINALLGEDRLLATDIAGTTRDAVDVTLEREGQTFVFVDTAGLRRKRSIAERLEQFSVIAALRSVDRADVVVVVLDGSARPSDQDARIAAIAHEKGKGVVVVANKWDRVENPEWSRGFPKAVRLDLSFVDYAPLHLVSAKTGRGLKRLLPSVIAVQRERHRRIGTGALNRFFEAVVEHSPPRPYRGKRARLYYATQPMVRPPTFVFTAANPNHVPTTYARYLRNALRERFGFSGTPIWLKFRGRGKAARAQTRSARTRKLTK